MSQLLLQILLPLLLPACGRGTADEPSRADTVWEEEAHARIEQHRKADITLNFVDRGSGAPLTSLHSLFISLARHEFLFGTAFAPEKIADLADRQWYLAMTAKHFNALTPEQAFRWQVRPCMQT